jgi:C1A family cysteine protease
MISLRTVGIALLVVASGYAGMAGAQLTAEDIQQLQQRALAEHWTFTVGENSATKYSLEQLCGYKRPADFKPRAASVKLHPMDLPSAFDWRALGGTTPIRDQDGCGSCWAFGTAGSFECCIKVKDGIDVDLAEQWLVSCNQSGYGCGGGLECFEYFLNPGDPGVATDPCGGSGAVMEKDFPYAASDLPCECPYPHPYYIDSWAYIGTAWDVPPADDIKQAIMTYGPVNVAVGVNSAFQAYTGGIFGGTACQSGIINHQVVLVGWDDDYQGSGRGVWILRNSWNTGWGDNGYMYIEYGCSDVGYGACFCVYAGADVLKVDPLEGFETSGPIGGPFTPSSKTYTLTNDGDISLDWTVTDDAAWLDVTPAGGTLAAGGAA